MRRRVGRMRIVIKMGRALCMIEILRRRVVMIDNGKGDLLLICAVFASLEPHEL